MRRLSGEVEITSKFDPTLWTFIESNVRLEIPIKKLSYLEAFMNFTIPLIALCMAISKLTIKKFRNSSFTPYILTTAAIFAAVFFNIGFGNFVSSKILILLCILPVINLSLFQILSHFGWSRYSIPLFILINLIGTTIFIPHGFLVYLQAAWSLSLISSILITNYTDFYKPLIEARRKNHEQLPI